MQKRTQECREQVLRGPIPPGSRQLEHPAGHRAREHGRQGHQIANWLGFMDRYGPCKAEQC